MKRWLTLVLATLLLAAPTSMLVGVMAVPVGAAAVGSLLTQICTTPAPSVPLM